MSKIIHLICAARPNFMKIAPLWHALKRESWCTPVLIHTGQHYDVNMSDDFFRDLHLPDPDFHLGIGSGSHGEQTGKTLIAYESLCVKNRPDLCIVVGDVNATVACGLAAVKLGIPVGHVEAGLRSFDYDMPEEWNRILTDRLSTFLWTHSPDAVENLEREGMPMDAIQPVGNIMIDALEMTRKSFEKSTKWRDLGLEDKGYALVTLHRPSNVDRKEDLERSLNALEKMGALLPVVFPVHPRTQKMIEEHGQQDRFNAISGLKPIPPQGYADFMNLVVHSRMIITDSGGIQEECAYLNIPCLTLRSTTERPITITHGTNRLVKPDRDMIKNLELSICDVIKHPPSRSHPIPQWDGHTADRIVKCISEYFHIRKFLVA